MSKRTRAMFVALALVLGLLAGGISASADSTSRTPDPGNISWETAPVPGTGL